MIAGESIPHAKAGEYISARAWNRLVDETNRLSRLSVVGGTAFVGPGGVTAIASETPRIYARILSQTGAGFAWQEVLHTGGGWVDGPQSGTAAQNAAFELNAGSPTSFPFITMLKYDDVSGSWLFQLDSCG